MKKILPLIFAAILTFLVRLEATVYTFNGVAIQGTWCCDNQAGTYSANGTYSDLTITAYETGSDVGDYEYAQWVPSASAFAWGSDYGIGNSLNLTSWMTIEKTNGSSFTLNSVRIAPFCYSSTYSPPTYEYTTLYVKAFQGSTQVGYWSVWTNSTSVFTTLDFSTIPGFTYTGITKIEVGAGHQQGYIADLTLDAVSVTAPTVTTSAASSIATTSATGNGNITATGGENCDKRGVCWDLAANADPDINDSKAESTGSYSTGAFTGSLTSLSVNTQYKVRAYAHNTAGYGYGSAVNFYTLSAVPSAPTVAAVSTSSVSVDVNVNGNPAATEFAIYETTTSQYVQSGGTLGASAAWQTDAAWGTKTVTGLSTNTQYTFEVKARNGAGTPVETSFGSTASIYTLAAVPSAPTVAAISVSSVSVDVNVNGNPAATEFAIYETTTSQYLQSGGTLGASAAWQTDPSWGTKTVTGLSANTQYTFEVKARNGAGTPVETAYGSTSSVTTLPTPPSATNLTQTVSYLEGASSAAIADIVVTAGSNPTITATLTLANLNAGTLTASSGHGESYNASTGIWTVTGTVTNVNAALAAVSFTPSATNDYDGRIITHIQDASGTGPNNGIITLDVTPVNNSPVFSSTPVTTGKESSSYTYTAIAGDLDGNRLTYSAPGLPAWLTLGPSDPISVIYGTIDITATYYITGIGFDSFNNMYVADYYHRVIRKIDANTGANTIVAGTLDTRLTSSADAGDGGLATSGRLRGATDIQFDSQNNMYLSDYGAHIIRKVNNSTGIITTILGNHMVSGTPALAWTSGVSNTLTAAGTAICFVWTLAVDRWDNLYVASACNNAIYKVANGVLSLVAGVPAGYSSGGEVLSGAVSDLRLNAPTGICADANGDLFVADRDNRLVRKINVAAGTFTTIAGTFGVNTSTGDGGAATSATLISPHRIAVDSHGNVYITEEDDSGPSPTGLKIRRIDGVTGIITTIAGTGTQGFTGNGGSASSAQLYDPYGLTLDASGNIYVSEGSGNVVRKIYNKAALTGTPSHSNVGLNNVTINAFDGTNTTSQTFTINVLPLPDEVWVNSNNSSTTSGWEYDYFADVPNAVANSASSSTVNVSNVSTSNINTDNNTFVIGAQDFTVTGTISGSGLIKAISTGYLKMTPSQGVNKIYPLTDGSNNYTLTINCGNSPSQPILVKINNAKTVTGALSSDFWDISGETNLNATLTFRIPKSSIAGGVFTNGKLFRYWNGSRYVAVPQANVTISDQTTYYNITISGINAF